MKLFLLKRTDGGVTVLQMIQQPDGSYTTPEQDIAKWAPHIRDQVISWRQIDPEDLPKDSSFRDAWYDSGKTIGTDMAKARSIHRDHLREMRVAKLAALDIEMTRAFNNPSRQKEIEAKRQALRDTPQDPSIEKANTPEELLAIMPDILK